MRGAVGVLVEPDPGARGPVEADAGVAEGLHDGVAAEDREILPGADDRYRSDAVGFSVHNSIGSNALARRTGPAFTGT